MYGVAQLWDMASVSRQKVIDNLDNKSHVQQKPSPTKAVVLQLWTRPGPAFGKDEMKREQELRKPKENWRHSQSTSKDEGQARLTPYLEAYTDDHTKMNSTARQLNDWRKALDESQNWKCIPLQSKPWVQ